jgi:hypothetical protein
MPPKECSTLEWHGLAKGAQCQKKKIKIIVMYEWREKKNKNKTQKTLKMVTRAPRASAVLCCV